MQKHIIIGDGIAGMSAAQYIRSKEPQDEIVIVTNDPQPFYYRAALTNYLSKRLRDSELLAMPLEQWGQLNLKRVYGSVTRLDDDQKTVHLADGKELSYDRLLIATGCRARRLKTRREDPQRGVDGADLPGIHVMRTLTDTRRIVEHIQTAKHAVVLGGGILGIEVCHGLHNRGVHVTFVHHKEWLLDRVVDRRAGELIAGRMRRDGIDVRLGKAITSIRGNDSGVTSVGLEGGKTDFKCDMLVTCIGNEPNTQWLAGTGVELNGGYIPVNRQLKVAGLNHVWAAGDVSHFVDDSLQFPNPSGLWQPARKQGQVAGRGMIETSSMATNIYAPGPIYNATTAWDLHLSTLGHHPDQANKGDQYETIVFDNVSGPIPVYKKVVLEKVAGGQRVVGAMLLGDRREGHALKHLMDLKGAGGDVSTIKHRLFDPTFDLASWVAFRKKQPNAETYHQTGVTSLSPIPISLINKDYESKAKDMAMVSPLKTSLAVATIDTSLGLKSDGQSEPTMFNQRAVRIGARDDYEVIVPQKSEQPETLLLSREGLKWVASSDARRSSLVRVNGQTLNRPITLADGDKLQFLDWSATVLLPQPELDVPKEVDVTAALRVNGKPFPIRHRVTAIGTTGENHVIVEDKTVSMHHAQLHRSGNPAQYILMDSGSKTGTFVEGRQIFGPTRILPGQKIQMGDSELALEVLEKPKKVTADPSKARSRIAPLAVQTPEIIGGVVVVDTNSKTSETNAENESNDINPLTPAVETVSPSKVSTKPTAENDSANDDVIFLTVEFGLNEGKTHEIVLPATIGRSSSADVTIRDTLLSREHCRIEKTSDGFTITDLESSNGLRVDGQKVEFGGTVSIESGITIELGRSVIRFSTSDEIVEPTLDQELAPQEAQQPSTDNAESERSSLVTSSTSPFRIDFATNGDPLAMADSKNFSRTIRDELDACIGCHECMRACPLESANAEHNPVSIGALNSLASGFRTENSVTLDFVDHCTQCQQCVPVCPVDIHRSRIVLWNKLKQPPKADKPIQVQQGDQYYESSLTAGQLAREFSDHPVLGALSETEMVRLFSEARYRTLSNQEILFNEGSYLDSVWFVLEGCLETGMATERNPFQSMVVLVAGNCVGETSVMADQPADFAARAVETTTVMGLSKYSLKAVMGLPGAGAKEFKKRMENLYASKSVEAFFIKQPAFEGISDDVVQQVVGEFSAERYLPGNLVLSDSESSKQLGVVKRGFVKEIRLRDGREIVSNYLQPGDAFGAIESEKAGSANAFLKRGHLMRYEAGTAAEVLTVEKDRLRRKFPMLASILESKWKTEDAVLNQVASSSCPDGHDGIVDLDGATDILHANRLLVINTATCVDCDNCVSACERRHGHARLDRRGSGRQIGQFQIPASCFHCEDPVCLLCNVDGIVRLPTGEIQIKEDNCIGCRGCAERCPYDNIQMVPKNNNDSVLSKWLPKSLAELIGIKQQDPDELPQSELVASKCDLCAGKDGNPACVRSCPTGAAQRVDPIEHFLSR